MFVFTAYGRSLREVKASSVCLWKICTIKKKCVKFIPQKNQLFVSFFRRVCEKRHIFGSKLCPFHLRTNCARCVRAVKECQTLRALQVLPGVLQVVIDEVCCEL